MHKKYDNFSSKHSFHSFFILRISKYCLFKDRLHYHFWPYIILPLSTGSCQTYVKYSINMTCSETCFRIHLQFIFGNKLFFRLLTIWLQKTTFFIAKNAIAFFESNLSLIPQGYRIYKVMNVFKAKA